jgi:DNA (cytosine-5)-methyltransferase 1
MTKPIKLKKHKIYSFFSGSGFLDLGFELAGFDVAYVNEYHKPFLDAYKYSRGRLGISEPEVGYFCGSVESCLDGAEAIRIKESLKNFKLNNDIVGFIGGPPCPDFSVAGKNKGQDGENGKLSQTYIDLICLHNPDFFVFENVKGLWKTKTHRAFYEKLKEQLRSNGYLTTEKLINSIEYGPAQDSERIILFGFKKKAFPKLSSKIDLFPWNKYIKYNREELFKLEWPKAGEAGLANVPQDLTVQYWFERNEVAKHPNSVQCFKPRAGLKKFETIMEGDDCKKCFKRLHRFRYSPTAAYGNNEVHIHPTEARRISAAEALSIQSLPKEFCLPPDMTLTNMFKTIGNGVPFLAANGIAKSIFDFLEGH